MKVKEDIHFFTEKPLEWIKDESSKKKTENKKSNFQNPDEKLPKKSEKETSMIIAFSPQQYLEM